MKIKKLMSTNIVTVELDDSLSMVKEIFDHVNFHHLLVIENSTLFGIISDRDFLKSLSPNVGTAAETNKDLACLSKKVHQIMTRKPISLDENATLKEAVEVFNTHKISCIPIVNKEKKPVGIVSWRDIMKELGHRMSNK